MRHKISGRRLSKTSSHRKAMFRNMVTSLIMNERINTTSEKAKELRSVAEKLVTLAKRGDLHARRQALRVIRSIDAMKKLFDDYSKRFENRNGGYTRIIKTGFRHGDNAKMSIIEFLPVEKKEAPKKGKAKKKALVKKKAAKTTKAKEPVKVIDEAKPAVSAEAEEVKEETKEEKSAEIKEPKEEEKEVKAELHKQADKEEEAKQSEVAKEEEEETKEEETKEEETKEEKE